MSLGKVIYNRWKVVDKVKALESDGKSKVTKFSVTGYSLGGLIARYVIGLVAMNLFVRPNLFGAF